MLLQINSNGEKSITIINSNKKGVGVVNTITGVGGASSGPESGGGDADQAGSGGLQQVQASPYDGLDVATLVAAVSTTSTTTSDVTTYAAVTTVAATSIGATTSVGKGSSGGRSEKGKGPASKRCSVLAAVPAPTIAPAPASTVSTTTVVATAGSSTSSSLPDPSSLELGPAVFVDLFGFVVLSEISEMVDKIIFDIRAAAKAIYQYTVRAQVSDAISMLSNSERFAWCLVSMKFYEAKFVTKCLANYCFKILPDVINRLCSIRVWDSSSRSFVPLMGSRLVDFWVSLDKDILRAIVDCFIAKWRYSTGRLRVPFFAPLDTGEGSSILCGRDFVGFCAKAGTSSLSVSRFASITGMREQVAPHGGDFADLFGFEVPSEVREMVSVLICEISALARSTYSSTVRSEVLHALIGLSDCEQRAWLIANMMFYKTAFMARCFAEYCDGLCPGFICSLFSVVPGDVYGRGFLSLTGDSLRAFWMSLGEIVAEIVVDIFATEWSALTRRFFVPLGPGGESPCTVLRGRDFISALARVGIPDFADPNMRVREARRVVYNVSEVDDSSSMAGVTVASGGYVSASSVVTASVEVKEFPIVPGSGSLSGPTGPKKLLMSRYNSAVGASSSGMSSGSSADAGSLSQLSVGMVGVSSVVTTATATTSTTAYTYSGEGDIGKRLAALLNRDLPPSPPPAISESAPTEGEASSSSRRSGRGKRKKKS